MSNFYLRKKNSSTHNTINGLIDSLSLIMISFLVSVQVAIGTKEFITFLTLHFYLQMKQNRKKKTRKFKEKLNKKKEKQGTFSDKFYSRD